MAIVIPPVEDMVAVLKDRGNPAITERKPCWQVSCSCATRSCGATATSLAFALDALLGTCS